MFLLLPGGDQDSYLVFRSLDPHESTLNGFSIGSAIFAQLTHVTSTLTDTHTHTHTHTGHATYDIY